jgi:hypothetical protein
MKILKSVSRNQVMYGAIGTVIVVVGGVFGYRAVRSSSSKPSVKNPTPTSQTSPVASQPSANYNGVYTGTTNVTQGIANASATVTGNNTISGTATYKGPFNAQIPVSISGVVDANGVVSGTISGSGVVQGVNVTVSGTFSGSIKGTTATVDYTVKANGVTSRSVITLNKQ